MRPPRLATLLLRLGGHAGPRAEIEADAAELFDRRLALHGARYARRRYWTDVLSVLSPRRQATLRHGGIATAGGAQEDSRMMAAFWFDLRAAARAVTRQPGFFAVAALTLAVGCAAHFAAFSIVDRLLLAWPAHVRGPETIYRLHIDRDDGRVGRFLWFQTPYRSYLDLREGSRAFAAMAAYRTATASVGTGADARQISMVFADHHYFPLLGVSAGLGRVFGADEDRAPSGSAVVVLSDAYWRSAYGRDPGVPGRTIRIGTKAYTIIGVAPPGFTGDTLEPVDAWAPLHAGTYEWPSAWSTSLTMRTVTVLTRTASGVTQSAAADDSTAAYRRTVTGTPAADDTARVVLASLSPGRQQRGELTAAARIAVWLEGVSLLVLLVAIANVVNLQMSRGAQQRREIAVRAALGAGRGRLLGKVAIEMAFVALAGGAAAVLLTYWSATTLQQVLMPAVTGAIDLRRFAAVAGLTILAATAICVVFASMQVSVEGTAGQLRTGRGGEGFSRARLRQGLLVAQVVMSSLLLVGAGLFLRSMLKLGALEFGHDQDRVLVVSIPLRSAGYRPEAIEAFYRDALDALATLPGVENVAAAQTTPFAPSQSTEIFVPGMDRLPFDRSGYPTFYTVTPAFLETMGMRVLRGRGFTDADREGAAPVMLLEEALAETIWPGGGALGKCISVGTPSAPCRAIVGITSNTRRFVSDSRGSLRYYIPMGQRVYASTPQALFVRTTGSPAAAAPAVRAALLRVDAALPFAQMRTLRDMAQPEMRPWRLGSTLFVIFGAAALFVATAGVYALLSFIVVQRSREIGVRLALGASPGHTLRMVVRQSLGWVIGGLVAGLVAALAAGRFIQPLLFETSPYDPSVFAATAALLVSVAFAASLLPAIRASRVDPNVTLRAE